MIKIYFIIIIFLLLSNCSFNTNSKFWDEGSNNNSGRAYIFDLSGTLLHTLSNPNAQTNTKHYDTKNNRARKT